MPHKKDKDSAFVVKSQQVTTATTAQRLELAESHARILHTKVHMLEDLVNDVILPGMDDDGLKSFIEEELQEISSVR